MYVLVTGGSGMLGQAVIEQLRQAGHRVRSFDLKPHPDPAVENHIGDLRSASDAAAACAGVDAVVHTASVINLAVGKPRIVYDVNVTGTQNVIDACRRQGVRRLVYTSSLDVVFDGTPIRNGNEGLPYARQFFDYYGETKAEAEKLVLAANGIDGVYTCSLRPTSVYGPHDRVRFPTILRSVRQSGMFARFGSSPAMHTHVYSVNVAHAHRLAVEALDAGSPLAGQVYFITDHPPTDFIDFYLPYFEALGLQYRVTTIPLPLAQVLAFVSETTRRLRPPRAGDDGALSRYVVSLLSRECWFSHAKAARDFGYAPIVSQQDAFATNLAWLRAQGF
jgi:nucleoside-diphosphate-sugar epimerase